MENKENMENNDKSNGFQYVYSAKEQDELKKIREKYAPRAVEEEDKMERLRRLDRGVHQRAQATSIAFGVVGALILGIGMSLVMTEFANVLGSLKDFSTIIGVVVGVIGGAVAGLAYPMYNFVLKKGKAKVAPEIIKLTDELLK